MVKLLNHFFKFLWETKTKSDVQLNLRKGLQEINDDLVVLLIGNLDVRWTKVHSDLEEKLFVNF